jgi:hypothetical protein
MKELLKDLPAQPPNPPLFLFPIYTNNEQELVGEDREHSHLSKT